MVLIIKFVLAVTRENFIDIAFDVFEEHKKIYGSYTGEEYCMEEVVATKKNIHTIGFGADVVIARGMVFQTLKKYHKNLPLVEVPVPATDIMRALLECTKKYHPRKIGMICPQRMIDGMVGLYELISCDVQSYIFSETFSSASLVNQAIEDGCDAVIGGGLVCKYASSININNTPIKPSRESFMQAIDSAKLAVQFSRNKQKQLNMLNVILDSSNEGIFCMDSEDRIQTINKRAETIFRLNTPLTNMRIQDTSLPADIKSILINSQEFNNELYQFEKSLLNINKGFITVNNTKTGYVVNIQEAKGIQDLESKIRRTIYQKGHVSKYTFNDIIGISPIMNKTIETAKKYSFTESNILLIGESGTGKEIFAQSIHNHSKRKDGPFVAVNCAAIPDTLLESELFGYVQGAFTEHKKKKNPDYSSLPIKALSFWTRLMKFL